MGRFEGLAVLVTGATGGFGRRVCERLAENGAHLVLSDLDPKPVEKLAASLDTETVVLGGDIAGEELSEQLVRLAVDRFGRLDVAINNAGIAQSFVRLAQVPSDEARRVIDIDLMGVFYAMKHQLPQMERQHRQTGRGGVIVNIASVAGLVGAERLSVLFGGQAWRCRAHPLGRGRIFQEGRARERGLPGLCPHRHGE